MSYNTRSSRVRMDTINTLTFYNGEMTAARRSSPVPQLECVGKPCALYQPDVVQCTAVGRNGPDIEWKCQAELPSTIRFGRVEVSCEGYDSPDDPFILKGSCGLTYNLVRVDPSLENTNYATHGSGSYASRFTSKFVGNFFNFLTLALLFYMLYAILLRPLLAYFTRNMPLNTGAGGNGGPGGPGNPPRRPWFGGFGGWGPGGGGGSGGRPGGSGRPGDAPPPYSSSSKPDTFTEAPTSSSASSSLWSDVRRGVAVGAGSAVGQAAINAIIGGGRGNRARTAEPPFQQQQRYGSPFAAQPAFAARRSPFRDDDRGEGPSGTSGLGSMRTSSGFGGTRNR